MAAASGYSGSLLFFSGGTALREVSRQLAAVTENTVHVVTPFDSGGSSAAIRASLAMPAVGDIRNRLLALARPCSQTRRAIDFCSRRLPERGNEEDFRRLLCQMGDSSHECWTGMPEQSKHVIHNFFRAFLRRMPSSFNPLNASLGNLVIAGGYLEYGRDFGTVLSQLGNVLRARGKILPVVRENLHLGAILEDGSEILGQHLFSKLSLPVKSLFLSVYSPGRNMGGNVHCLPRVAPDVASAVMGAKCIVYSMGSFYSSLLANLLPRGLGEAVSRARCPKIYVPSSGHDAEAAGLTLARQARLIVEILRKDAPDASTASLLNYVLLDPLHGRYGGGLDREGMDDLRRLGAEIMEVEDLVCADDPGRHAPQSFIRCLQSLTGLPT